MLGTSDSNTNPIKSDVMLAAWRFFGNLIKKSDVILAATWRLFGEKPATRN